MMTSDGDNNRLPRTQEFDQEGNALAVCDL